MTHNLGWARVQASGTVRLRRGAWYPVISETTSDHVVVGVARGNVKVHRGRLELRPYRPAGFSVVFKTPADRNPVAGTQEDRGLVYAVCPWCAFRVKMLGFPDHLRCSICGHTGTVLWDDAC